MTVPDSRDNAMYVVNDPASTPEQLQDVFARQGGNKLVAEALARHSHTPTPVVVALFGRGPRRIQKLILDRPDCPDHLRTMDALSQ
ncbi:MAG: hypothetical protein ACRDX8_13075 [Acidimicrobiales bacterium]